MTSPLFGNPIPHTLWENSGVSYSPAQRRKNPCSPDPSIARSMCSQSESSEISRRVRDRHLFLSPLALRCSFLVCESEKAEIEEAGPVVVVCQVLERIWRSLGDAASLFSDPGNQFS